MARRLFSKPVHAKEERNGPPELTKVFLQLSPEAAMLTGPSVREQLKQSEGMRRRLNDQVTELQGQLAIEEQ